MSDIFFDALQSSVDIGSSSLDKVEEILMIFIKAADLSNVARPPHANERWVSRVYMEFHAQGERESKAGYPVSPGMAADDSVALGQASFGRIFTRPLYIILAALVPETGVFLDALDDNLARWQRMHELQVELEAAQSEESKQSARSTRLGSTASHTSTLMSREDSIRRLSSKGEVLVTPARGQAHSRRGSNRSTLSALDEARPGAADGGRAADPAPSTRPRHPSPVQSTDGGSTPTDCASGTSKPGSAGTVTPPPEALSEQQTSNLLASTTADLQI